MKLVRPYIPLSVRLKVAERQLIEKYGDAAAVALLTETGSTCSRLYKVLAALLIETPQLDHDPALCNRHKLFFADGTFADYMPRANDPKYLIYRKASDHKTKTFVRGDGAQRSDVSQRRYLKRVAANRKSKRVFKPRRAKHIRRIKNAPITSQHNREAE
jgi:hypothetical protein